MKPVVVLLTSLLLWVPFSYSQKKQSQPALPPRYEKVINSNWTFNYFPDEKADKGYESPGFDDSRWPAVSIPHTWNTYETTGEFHPLMRSNDGTDNTYWTNGWGWYRKHFIVNTIASGKKVFVEFTGVQKYCRVWINGNYLGEHAGGYDAFEFNLTDFIIPGNDNLLAVAVRNVRENDSGKDPSDKGDPNIYGGIHNNVNLLLKNSLYIQKKGSSLQEGGVLITTPSVSEKEGVVRVITLVQNDYSEPKECILNTYITDASDRNVQVIKSKAKINPKQVYKFDQILKPVAKPHLWSPDDPYLYQVRSEVLTDNKIADIFSSPLAFRRDFTDNSNNVSSERVQIGGKNRYREYPWLGIAVPEPITEIDLWDAAENLIINTADSTSAGRLIPGKVRSGEPAKIVLKSSHNKINADRGSVAIITADIVDSEGTHVSGATNTIKWSVTGPAILSGPSVYEPEVSRQNRTKGVWYRDMPVPNVIRSNGSAGRITVMVSTPGLASGSIAIEAVEVKADNSVISEPLLNDEGRRRVFRPEMSVKSLDEPDGELKRTSGEINLGPGSEDDYKAEISGLIVKSNPAVDITTTEYKALVSLLAAHLLKNGGRMMADDYNFNIGHYNNCRIITGFINPLKLPPLFKDCLKKYYADEIIVKGNEKNSGDEMNWLNWIPSGGTVVVSQAGKVPLWPKGTIVTEKSNLEDLIAAVHPVFVKYNPEAKERALEFIGKMNPYVHVSQTIEVKDGKKITILKYTAERSKPILIPLIKFISD